MSLERQIRTSPGRHFRTSRGRQIETSPGRSNRIFTGRPGDVQGGRLRDILGSNIFRLGNSNFVKKLTIFVISYQTAVLKNNFQYLLLNILINKQKMNTSESKERKFEEKVREKG